MDCDDGCIVEINDCSLGLIALSACELASLGRGRHGIVCGGGILSLMARGMGRRGVEEGKGWIGWELELEKEKEPKQEPHHTYP